MLAPEAIKLTLASPQKKLDAFRLAARIEAALYDFPTFLRFVKIREVFGIEEGESAIEFKRWPHLIERAESWQAGNDEVILKARQLGLSWLAAAYALFVGLRAGAQVLLLSQGQTYAFELLSKVEFIYEHLPDELKKPTEVDNLGKLTFEGGGTIQALPSTTDAGRGFTATLVIVDEAAFHPWGQQNYKAYRPTMADGGQIIILSTADGVGGFFYDQFWAAVRRDAIRHELEAGRTVQGFEGPEEQAAVMGSARAVFIPWHARPDRDGFWLARERLAWEKLPEEFPQEYPANAEEAFIRLTGLVFNQWSEARHVRGSDPVPWQQTLYRYFGWDKGGGDPSAIVILGVWKDDTGQERVHQYAELYKRVGLLTPDEAAAFLLPWHWAAPFMPSPPDPVDQTMTAAFMSQGLPIDLTAKYGLPETLGIHAMYLDNDWLTIGSWCQYSIVEFEGFRWAQRVDPNSKDRYMTSTPHDHHGDAIAARRLALTKLFYDMNNRIADGKRVAFSAVKT